MYAIRVLLGIVCAFEKNKPMKSGDSFSEHNQLYYMMLEVCSLNNEGQSRVVSVGVIETVQGYPRDTIRVHWSQQCARTACVRINDSKKRGKN